MLLLFVKGKLGRGGQKQERLDINCGGGTGTRTVGGLRTSPVVSS